MSDHSETAALHRRRVGGPRLRRVLREHQPRHARGALPRRSRQRRRCRRGGRLGARDLRRPALARPQPDPPRAPAAPARRPHRRARRGARPVRNPGQRQAAARNARPVGHAAGVLLLLRRPGGQDPRGRRSHLRPQGAELHLARAARRGRGDHPLELAPDADDEQAGPRPVRRQHGGDQAVGVHVGDGPSARRAGHRGRLPAGGGQHRDRVRRRGRAAAGRSPCPGQDLVHRQHGHGCAHRVRRGRPVHRVHPRARRQIAEHRVRGRQRRERRDGCGGRDLRRRGPDLHRRQPGVRTSGGLRRAARAGDGTGPQHPHR